MNKLTCSMVMILGLSGCGGSGSDSNPDNNDSAQGDPVPWLIPADKVADGGPGKDGIPAVDAPFFVSTDHSEAESMDPDELVVGLVIDGVAKAFPHRILNWHEVVNEDLPIDSYTLSYCPLTGSAIAWQANEEDSNKTYGVSGLLYNSNLILYDRETDSLWSQMQQRSVTGERIGDDLASKQKRLIEVSWQQWRQWYPDTVLMSESTGYSRNYNSYPYGDYLDVGRTLFSVDNEDDDRMFAKARLLGVNINGSYQAYEISEFSADWQVLYDQVGGKDLVLVGSAGSQFAIAFERPMVDGSLLELEPVSDGNRYHLRDQSGALWNIFGQGASEENSGQQLAYPNQYVAFWFAWTAFFPETSIYSF